MALVILAMFLIDFIRCRISRVDGIGFLRFYQAQRGTIVILVPGASVPHAAIVECSSLAWVGFLAYWFIPPILPFQHV